MLETKNGKKCGVVYGLEKTGWSTGSDEEINHKRRREDIQCNQNEVPTIQDNFQEIYTV